MSDGEFVSMYGLQDYMAAIQAAPNNTLILLGDLDRNVVICTTCNAKMDRKAAEYHKHPKECDGCGDTFDENTERHEPIHENVQRGATLVYSSGCRTVKL